MAEGQAPALPAHMQIGLALPTGENDQTHQTPPYGVIRSPAMQAEAVGDKQPDDPAETLAGAAEDVAAALHAYQHMGVGHVICSLSSATEEASCLQ